MIRRLAPHTIQQIAAGEVVERPASALKELLENTIDAGATRIVVSFDQGGLGQLVVDDNGVGIEKEDLPLVFEPHATSKISVMNDLEQLTTYGFRGEALAAISSIADVELWTSAAESDVGWRIHRSFGAPLEIKASDRRQGTQIIVRQLFAQTPARLKFMKTPRAETMALQNIFKKYVLCYPKHHFELKDLQTSRQQVWPKQSEIERVLWYFDSQDIEDWIVVDGQNSGWTIHGWVLNPHQFGKCRSGTVFYFNGRPIKDSKLEFSLKRAFEGHTDQIRSLAAVMWIVGPSDQVDVNIHPRKNEIQFKNPDEIASLLVRSVRNVLETSHRQAPIPHSPWLNSETNSMPAQIQQPIQFHNLSAEIEPTVETEKRSFSSPHLGVSVPDKKFSIYEYLGEIDQTYLIARAGPKLYLFDQHALHERILYERLLTSYKEQSRIDSQRLLFPVSVSLSNAEYLFENEELVSRLGFELRLWNDQKVQIVAAPSVLKRDHQSVLEKLIESQALPLEAALRESLATVACHSAVRAHDRLQPEEIRQLFRDFEGQDSLGHCPHGRPTFISFSCHDLEKLFHRVL